MQKQIQANSLNGLNNLTRLLALIFQKIF